jgi:predicted lipoprotein
MRIILNTHSPHHRQLVSVLATLAMGCPPSKPPPIDTSSELRATLLEAVGTCSLRAVSVFRDEAQQLAGAPTREGWRRAMTAWQRVEVLQFGPTGSSSAPGGQDFRDQIYSWPLVSRCAVDTVLVQGSYEAGVSELLVNRRGLAALEYLLFYEGDDVSCGAETWATLSPQQRTQQRAAYAKAVADDVSVRANDLAAAWNGGFVETLTSAGPGNPTYPNGAAALTAVSDALFYFEAVVKDLKLARPLGLRDCTTAPCLDAVESPYSRHNKENLKANLVAVRQVLEGCGEGFSGVGFDDLLAAKGASAVSAKLKDSAIVAQTALEAIEEPDLNQALVADPPSVQALYDAVRAVTTLLKGEFVTALNLEIPSGVEGDND